MIPIARPCFGAGESAAAVKVIESGWLTQGPMVKQFEEKFASTVGAQYACAVSNCTSALHLALLAVGVMPGDVVITVSHSFIATANSVRCCFAEPVFVDIDPDTFNMSPAELEKCLVEDCEQRDGGLYYRNVSDLAFAESPLRNMFRRNALAEGMPERLAAGRVAAIMPVHQMGMPCDMPAILELAAKFNLPVVEDAACAIGSELNGADGWQKIGSPHGDIACFSFHPRKIVATGDGGMITTGNADYDTKFRLLRQHGMSLPDTVRHGADRVLFEDYLTTGFNYRMTDLQAAIGIEQLEKLPGFIEERREIAAQYHERLQEINWLKPSHELPGYKTNWQSYPVFVKSAFQACRNELMQHLLDKGIATRRGIMNAHQEAPYASNLSLKQSEQARDSVILLPIYNGMKKSEVDEVVKGVMSYVPKACSVSVRG